MFDSSGNLVDLQQSPIPKFVRERIQDRELNRLQELFQNHLVEELGRLGLNEGQVRVKRFLLQERAIGIGDLPDYLQEYLSNPDSFPPSEALDLADTIQAWKEEDLFVFWWEEEYTVDSEGIVASS